MSIEKREGPRGVRWLVRVDLGPDAEGNRRQRKRTVTTKAEARALEARWRSAIDDGTAPDGGNITLRDYARQWLTEQSSTRTQRSTSVYYRRWLENYILPELGGYHLERLKSTQIRTWKTKLLAGPRRDGKAGGYSTATVRLVLALLTQIVADAQTMGLVRTNVAAAVVPPRLVRDERPIWTVDLVRQFLAATAGTPYYPLWLLALGTGMRRGELLGLRWQDVDLDRGILFVRASLTQLPGGLVLQEPKTPHSRRVIALPHSCVITLHDHAARQRQAYERVQLGWSPGSFVFATAGAAPYQPEQVTRAFKLQADRAGLPPIRFYDLRHSHASLLLAEGTHSKIISERLGHANLQITERTYLHVPLSLQTQAANTIDDLLTRAQNGHSPNQSAEERLG